MSCDPVDILCISALKHKTQDLSTGKNGNSESFPCRRSHIGHGQGFYDVKKFWSMEPERWDPQGMPCTIVVKTMAKAGIWEDVPGWALRRSESSGEGALPG
jgi:hypothetical protein